MGNGKFVADSDAWVPNGLRVRGVAPRAQNSGRPTPEHQQLAPTPEPSTPPPLTPPETSPEPVLELPVEPTLVTAPAASTGLPQDWTQQALAPPAKLSPTDGRVGFRPAPILTLLVLCCLAVLWMLGQWQYGKYQIKNAPAPVEAVPDPAPVAAALEAGDPEYRPVVAEGIVDEGLTKVYAVQDGVRGARLFSHIVLEAGVIFVDRGFVAEADMNRIKLAQGTVRLSGVLRRGAPSNSFTPENDPGSNTWYWPDLDAMAKARGIEATSVTYYIAENPVDPLGSGAPVENIWARKAGVSTVTAGQHLGYAWQWWGFGIGLIGVYIGLHMRMGRLSFRARTT
jgi:surfeit locus 1 family protein